MNKALQKLVLALLTALVLGCRSGPPPDGGAGPDGGAVVSPERPPAASRSAGADVPPVPSPPQAAAEPDPVDVTLPRPDAAPPAEEGAPAGEDLPLPAPAAGDPLALLNRLPPDMENEADWPPLEAYWRRAGAEEKAEAAVSAPQAPAAAPAAAAPAAPPASSTPESPPPASPAPARAAAPPGAAVQAQIPARIQTPAPEGRVILARREDRVEVQFDDAGWLFLGLDSRITSDEVSFLSRESEGGRTAFTFRVHELGSYDLNFQLQDTGDGSVSREKVIIDVLTEEDFNRRLAASQATEATGGEDPAPDYERAERLYARGELDLALIEFISNYREGGGYVDDRIAGIYLAGREYEAALKYYRRNLDAAAADRGYRDKAVLGAMRAALGLKDPELVLEFLDDFLGLRSLPTAGELVEAARLQLDVGRHAGARLLLREYRTRYPRGERMDEVLFLLGRLYEQDSPLRDLEASRAYYQRVYDEYPESLRADEARERLRYLDRHFFHVQ